MTAGSITIDKTVRIQCQKFQLLITCNTSSLLSNPENIALLIGMCTSSVTAKYANIRNRGVCVVAEFFSRNALKENIKQSIKIIN